MIPWELLDSGPVPGHGGTMTLHRRGGEFSIRIDGEELMNSRAHGSEEALAELACGRVGSRPRPRVLIGGLGMGFTLAAALAVLDEDARVVVAELVPKVIEWNRDMLSTLAGSPLDDGRSEVVQGDVGEAMRAGHGSFDAILLDVDNGPEPLTHEGNVWLYSSQGLEAAFEALRPGGVLAVWSAGPDEGFRRRLKGVGFKVEEVASRARGVRGGARHRVWLATRR